jgi:hypothetical protein
MLVYHVAVRAEPCRRRAMVCEFANDRLSAPLSLSCFDPQLDDRYQAPASDRLGRADLPLGTLARVALRGHQWMQAIPPEPYMLFLRVATASSGRCGRRLVAVFFPMGGEFVHHWTAHSVGGFQ